MEITELKVWDIISTNTIGPLFKNKGTIDGKRYLKMFEDNLLQSFSQLKGTIIRKGSLGWQQDNVPCSHIQNCERMAIFGYIYKMVIIKWVPHPPLHK